MNYCVDVPAEASRALGAGTHPPVAGEVAGVAFRTRLTPRGGGAYRLFLNGAVRAAAAAGVGDVVEVEVWPDEAPRDSSLPADLASALDAIPGGLEAFEVLTEAQRAGMVAFIERARTARTRARYVAAGGGGGAAAVGDAIANVRAMVARCATGRPDQLCAEATCCGRPLRPSSTPSTVSA